MQILSLTKRSRCLAHMLLCGLGTMGKGSFSGCDTGALCGLGMRTLLVLLLSLRLQSGDASQSGSSSGQGYLFPACLTCQSCLLSSQADTFQQIPNKKCFYDLGLEVCVSSHCVSLPGHWSMPSAPWDVWAETAAVTWTRPGSATPLGSAWCLMTMWSDVR